MQTYNANKAMASLSTTNDHCQVVSGGTRSTLVTEIDAQGGHTSSVSLESALFRVTTQGTGTAPGTTVPQPINAQYAVYSGTFHTGGAWGTAQPVLGAVPVHAINLNANGQRYYWRAQLNLSDAIVLPGGGATAGALSMRGIVGGQSVSTRLKLVEF